MKTTYDTTDFFQVYDVDDSTPEKRLLLAMVQRAVLDYANPEKGKEFWQHDAYRWLFSTETHPYTLVWVCEILSDNPIELQRRIQFAAKSKTYKSKYVIVRVER